ncbi:hypothetical protein [Metaclostridioides mangenotii]|nr:hypothetical protein [Clostridioides mangenotii]
MFIGSVRAVRSPVIILMTGAIAYFIAWMNDKLTGGSIVSSRIVHGLRIQ